MAPYLKLLISHIFSDCLLLFQEGDQTSVSFVARSIVTLQQLYGTIPTMYGLGDCAKVCTNMLGKKT